jgi:hypothetical protein
MSEFSTIQTFIITPGHKYGVALGRGRMKGGGGNDRNGHSANPGLTFKAINTTAMLTQGAVSKPLQVIRLAHEDFCLGRFQASVNAPGGLFNAWQFGFCSAGAPQRFAALDVAVFAESAAHNALNRW